MDLMTTIYIIIGFTIFLCIFIFIFAISGKDILFAIMRWIDRKGCDIFIFNHNRHVSHHYRRPKNGIFRIGNNPYITNPDKTENLTEKEKISVKNSIFKTVENFKKKIKNLEQRRSFLENQIKLTDNKNTNNIFKSEIENINTTIKIYKDKLKDRTTFYFKDKRPAFFYIENDPVPKDLFEFYSELDSKILDNIMARAITQPPEKYDDKQLKFLKMVIIGALIAAGLAAILSFQTSTQLNNLCVGLEIACN